MKCVGLKNKEIEILQKQFPNITFEKDELVTEASVLPDQTVKRTKKGTENQKKIDDWLEGGMLLSFLFSTSLSRAHNLHLFISKKTQRVL